MITVRMRPPAVVASLILGCRPGVTYRKSRGCLHDPPRNFHAGKLSGEPGARGAPERKGAQRNGRLFQEIGDESVGSLRARDFKDLARATTAG